MKKNRFALLLVLMALLSFVHVQAAEKQYENTDTGYVVVIEDMCNLLSASQEHALAQQMQQITAYGNVAFISVDQSEATSIYAMNAYHRLFGARSGTVFVIDMGRRNIYIFSDGDVYKTITNAYANTITDNCYRYATDGRYYECAREVFAQELTLLEGGKIARPMKHITNLLISLAIGIMVNFIILSFDRSPEPLDPKDAAEGIGFAMIATNATNNLLTTTRRYSPPSDSSSGSSSSGGGSSGGGGGHGF